MANNRAQILISAIDDTKRAFKSVESNLLSLKNIATSVGYSLRNAVGAIGLGISLKELSTASDKYKELQVRLRLAVLSLDEFNDANKELFDISQKSRAPLEDTVFLFTRLTQSVRNLGYSQQDALRVTEAINRSIALSGSSAAAASGALVQLGHAFSSGFLRGKEYNSIVVNIQRLAKAIADGLNVPIGNLLELSHQGALTTDVLVRALLDQAERLDIEHSSLGKTIEGSLTKLHNSFLVVFGSRSVGATNVLSEIIDKVAMNLESLVNLVGVVLVAAFGRMVSSLIISVAAINSETSARIAQLRLIQSEIAARILSTKAILAQSVAQGKNAAALRVSIATMTTEAINARKATETAIASTGLLARVSGIFRGILLLIGGPIGAIVTGLTLLAAYAYSAREQLVKFGGVTTSVGQIAVAVWEILSEKIQNIFKILTGFVGINKKTWDSLINNIEHGVLSIISVLNFLVNRIIGTFDFVGSVIGVTAAFIVNHFKNSFLQISNLAVALGEDIYNALNGDFSSNNLKNLLNAQVKEISNFSKELSEILQRSITKDYIEDAGKSIKTIVDNAVKSVASRIKPVHDKSEGLIFGKPDAEDFDAKENAKDKKLQLLKIQYDNEYKIIKDSLDRASRKIDHALEDRLISIREYYKSKTAIEQAGIDEEIKNAEKILSGKKELLDNSGDEESIAIKQEIIRLETDIIILNNKRADIQSENAIKSARSERDLLEEIRKVKLELSNIIKSDDVISLNVDNIVHQFSDLRKRLSAEGNVEGVSLVDRLIDVKSAKANLSEIESQWQIIIRRLENDTETIKLQQRSGLIAEYQAQKRISDLKYKSAEELSELLAKMENQSLIIGDNELENLNSLKNEINELKLSFDGMAETWDKISDSFTNSFWDMLTGAKTWRQSLKAIFRQVYESFYRYAVAEPFKQWFAMKVRMLTANQGFAQQENNIQASQAATSLATKSAETTASVSMDAAKAGAGAASSQAAIPIIGPVLAIAAMVAMVAAVLGLLSNIKKYASGGLVTGPGTSKSDSIPARLSDGEFIINADAVKRVGVGFLNVINGVTTRPLVSNNVTYFSGGGLVNSDVSYKNENNNSQSIKIVNVVDPELAGDYLNSSSGEKSVLNIIYRNTGAIKQVLT